MLDEGGSKMIKNVQILMMASCCFGLCANEQPYNQFNGNYIRNDASSPFYYQERNLAPDVMLHEPMHPERSLRPYSERQDSYTSQEHYRRPLDVDPDGSYHNGPCFGQDACSYIGNSKPPSSMPYSSLNNYPSMYSTIKENNSSCDLGNASERFENNPSQPNGFYYEQGEKQPFMNGEGYTNEPVFSENGQQMPEGEENVDPTREYRDPSYSNLFYRYEPEYSNEWHCEYETRYCYKKHCRYMPKYYQKRCCVYVPQYYYVTRIAYVPEYYYSAKKYEVPNHYAVPKCRYVKRYYYKNDPEVQYVEQDGACFYGY